MSRLNETQANFIKRFVLKESPVPETSSTAQQKQGWTSAKPSAWQNSRTPTTPENPAWVPAKPSSSKAGRTTPATPPPTAPKKSSWVSASPTQASKATLAAAQPAKRMIKGVDFSDDTQMLGIVEKYAEIAYAQIKVIDVSDRPSGYAKQKKALASAPGKITGANAERKHAYAQKDWAKVDAQLVSMQTLIDDVLNIAEDLRDIYRVEKQKIILSERKAHGAVTSSDTMHALMLDEFYEMAHMASLMAKEFNGKKENKKKKVPFEKMELGEIAAIYGYSTRDYTKINGRLRDPSSGDPSIDGYIAATVQGLKKLPRFKGSVVRCDQSAKYFFDEVVATGKRTEKAFMSAGLEAVPGFGHVESFVKKVKTGKEITGFSLHEGEGEVLFPPNSVFEFVRFTAADGTKIKKVSDLAATYPDGAAITNGVFEFKQIR